MTASRLREGARFVRSFLASPRRVGAVVPTSARAARAMLDMAPLERARVVVELGAGTGPHTREILARLGPEARLLAFEIDAALARGLAADLRDLRLEVVNDSAERAEHHLGGARADVIVSALPFTSLPADLRERLLAAARAALAPDGTLLVLQYSPFMQRRLEREFGSVERRVVGLNVPSAFLFACRHPRTEGADARPGPAAGHAAEAASEPRPAGEAGASTADAARGGR